MSVDSDNNETRMFYTVGDDGRGTSTVNEPLPAALGDIDKIAMKLLKGTQVYTCFFIEEGRVETNIDLVHLLNVLVQTKIPLVLA